MRKYIIGTGYYLGHGEESEFFDIWYKNTYTYSSPQEVYIVNSHSYCKNKKGIWIDLTENPGHSTQPNRTSIYDGATLSIVIPAMIAYACGCDFIHKEQDCLCFGDWVEQLYKDCEEQNVEMVLDHHVDDKFLNYEIALFLIKNSFIPIFLTYLFNSYHNNPDRNICTEHRIGKIAEEYKEQVGFMTMGYGRGKNPNFNDKAWYVQHVGYHEYESSVSLTKKLQEKGLL